MYILGYYQLEFYGYSAEKEDVEEICNYYTNNYSDLNYTINGKQVGLSIGGFNLTSPKIQQTALLIKAIDLLQIY